MDRLMGAMLGLAVGDALGAPAEFKSQAEVKRLWGTLTDMVGGGPWAPGEWTDDTGMALAVAEGILANPADPVEDVGRRFLQWRTTAKDVGSTIGAALRGYRGSWPDAARGTHQARSGKAAGNGSLMRTLPVALAYPALLEMSEKSARISAMTHWDPQAEVCCILYGHWIQRLLAGEPRLSAWEAALHEVQAGLPAVHRLHDCPGSAPLPPGFWPRLEAATTLNYGELQRSGYAGYVVECLEAAVWCCVHGESLEDALVKAVNLAGEADTIAAVAGGAAGAAWGYEAIPARWLDQLHERERLQQVSEELRDLRSHHRIYENLKLPRFTQNEGEAVPRVYSGRNPLSARDVRKLQQLGITHILDLREEAEWSAPGRSGGEALEALSRTGLKRVHIPITDMGAPDLSTIDRIIAALDDMLRCPEHRVYLHCRAGKERTGAVLLAYHCRATGQNLESGLRELQARCPNINPLSHQQVAVRRWLAAQPRV